jgi:hypothetical protein
MKPSTASFIPYDLRPAKQAERRILLDFLKCANEAGINISDSRYVGMGGTKFYDFHLINRFLGVDRMISLERHPQTHVRAAFSCPFKFIRVKQETVAEFLASDNDNTPTIYWLDYDDGISPEITADIISLGTRVQRGGFAFVTVYADPPGILQSQSKEERFEYFQQNFGDFAVGLTADDMENSVFSQTIYRVICQAFKNAFAARGDGTFRTYFQILYRDSTPMITIGGCFCTEQENLTFERRLRRDLPFLFRNPPYRIRNLNLTDRERALFDLAVTNRRSNSSEANSLKSLGFRPSDMDTYRDLLRFLPRYHESII